MVIAGRAPWTAHRGRVAPREGRPRWVGPVRPSGRRDGEDRPGAQRRPAELGGEHRDDLLRVGRRVEPGGDGPQGVTGPDDVDDGVTGGARRGVLGRPQRSGARPEPGERRASVATSPAARRRAADRAPAEPRTGRRCGRPVRPRRRRAAATPARAGPRSGTPSLRPNRLLPPCSPPLDASPQGSRTYVRPCGCHRRTNTCSVSTIGRTGVPRTDVCIRL